MNIRNIVTLGGFAFILLLGASRSYSYVQSTIAENKQSPRCGKLPGVPGLLQAAGFIPISSGCAVERDGGCRDHRECSVRQVPSGAPKRGRCTTVYERIGREKDDTRFDKRDDKRDDKRYDMRYDMRDDKRDNKPDNKRDDERDGKRDERRYRKTCACM